MRAISRLNRRTPRILALVFACGAGALLVDACVIADPVTDLPQNPEMRPNIVISSVVPPPSAVLGRWPSKFIVPVELVNPRQTFFWSAFVDYDPTTGAGFRTVQSSEFEPGSNTTQGLVRTFEVAIAAPPSLDRCHVVEIIVALRFVSRNDSRSAHTPDAPGGDRVTWFYSPTGDLAGCPLLDAGLIPIVEADASADADGAGGPP